MIRKKAFWIVGLTFVFGVEGGVFAQTTPSQGFLEKTGLSKKIKKEIAQLELDEDLDLELDIMDGLKAMVGYTYAIEPAFLGKRYYTRVDKYKLKVGLDAGDLLEDMSPVFLNVNKGAEVVFARLMPNQKKALTAMPIPVTQVPFNAAKLDKLAQGTFVSIPTYLNIMYGVQKSSHLAGDLPISGRIFHLLSGDFNIHILKLPENKVRMRIFTKRLSSKQASAAIKHSVEFFEISVLNNAVNKVFKTDIAEVYARSNKGNVILFDYVLDMNHSEVRAAYDKVLSSTFKFKRFQVLNPFTDSRSLERSLVSDLSDLETLALADRGLDDRRVEKVIQGQDKFESKALGYGLRLSVMNWKGQNEFSKHHFSFVKGDEDERKNLVMMNRSEGREKSMLFSLGKEESEVNYYAVGLADSKGRPLADGVTDIGFNLEIKDRKMDVLEQQEMQARINKQLPKAVSDLIEWNKIMTNYTQTNTRVFFNVIFNRKAKNLVRRMGPAFVQAELKEFRDYLWKTRGYVFAGSDGDLRDFQNKVTQVLENGLSGSVREEKMTDFVKLTRDDTFEQIGLGAILHLLASSGEPLDQLAKVDLVWNARDRDSYHFSFGFSDKREEYESLEFIREAIIRSNSYDFRILGYQP